MRQEFPDQNEFESSQLAYELGRRSVVYDTMELMSFYAFADLVEIGSLRRVLRRYDDQSLPVVAVIKCIDQTSTDVFIEHEMLAIGQYLCIERAAFERIRLEGLSANERKSLGDSLIETLSITGVTSH